MEDVEGVGEKLSQEKIAPPLPSNNFTGKTLSLSEDCAQVSATTLISEFSHHQRDAHDFWRVASYPMSQGTDNRTPVCLQGPQVNRKGIHTLNGTPLFSLP